MQFYDDIDGIDDIDDIYDIYDIDDIYYIYDIDDVGDIYDIVIFTEDLENSNIDMPNIKTFYSHIISNNYWSEKMIEYKTYAQIPNPILVWPRIKIF